MWSLMQKVIHAWLLFIIVFVIEEYVLISNKARDTNYFINTHYKWCGIIEL